MTTGATSPRRFTTPPHYTRLPPILPEARRLADLPEAERTARYHILNKWLTSESRQCPRAWVLREICSKLDSEGEMTDAARAFLMDDAERREFYRRTLRYLGFHPPPWTHPGDFLPDSGDAPVGVDYALSLPGMADLILARADAQATAYVNRTDPTDDSNIVQIGHQIEECLRAHGH